jgi:tetratricopeptide (TPR) repeat protein
MATVANSLYAPAGIHKDKKFIETHRAILERLEAADLAQLPNYEALTDRYPEGWPQFLATGLTVEAKIQAYAGSYGKAIELAERAYSIMTKDGGTETPACIQMRANLGFIKFLSGDTKGACEIQQATLASLVKIYGDEHPTVSPYKIRLARTYLKLRDFRGAIPLLEEVLLREEEFKTIQVGSSTTLGSSGVGVTSICRDLLDAYLATNRLSDAKSLLLSWLAAEDTTDVLLLQDALRVSKGLTKEDAKSLLDSIEQATRRGISSQRLPRIQRVFMADDVRQLALYSDCAMQHLELGDWVNAERLSRECVKQYKSLEEEGRFVSPTQTKPAKYCLGRVLFEQGKYEEAEPLLLAALWTEDELSMASEGMTNMAVTESLERLYQATGR